MLDFNTSGYNHYQQGTRDVLYKTEVEHYSCERDYIISQGIQKEWVQSLNHSGDLLKPKKLVTSLF